MYIEVIHDIQGEIKYCVWSDTLPEIARESLFVMEFEELDAQGKPTGKKTKQLPIGYEQVRINIDTLTAMEINGESGLKAVINMDTGLPEIKQIDRAEYLTQTFRVDVLGPEKIHIKPLKNLPVGMKVRGLVRR